MITRRSTILIVEDEPSQLMVLQDEFTDQGFTVLTAQNGKDGLATALEKRPDVILLDMMMPSMDGEKMLAELRRQGDYGKRVPVIVLTNLIPDDERRMKNIRRNAVQHYLVKSSWPLEAIVDCVKRQLG